MREQRKTEEEENGNAFKIFVHWKSISVYGNDRVVYLEDKGLKHYHQFDDRRFVRTEEP